MFSSVIVSGFYFSEMVITNIYIAKFKMQARSANRVFMINWVDGVWLTFLERNATPKRHNPAKSTTEAVSKLYMIFLVMESFIES
jgi:hypothetical protein